MPSYFDRFGRVPRLSAHAWRRMLKRGISLEGLAGALATQPRLGTKMGTVIYSQGGIEAVVDAETGVIITLWWTA
jgi:hypothetical protein